MVRATSSTLKTPDFRGQRGSKRMANPPDSGKDSPPTGDLAARIARARATERPGVAAAQRVRMGEMTGVGRGFRLASEFVAAIVVGAALGWGIDSIFSTRPWGMVILLVLG